MENTAQLLTNGQVDLCFTAIPIQLPGITEMHVLSTEVFLAVPPGHRCAAKGTINLSEVAGDPFIGYKSGHPFQQMNVEFLKKAKITPNVICEVDEGSAIEELVLAGLGVAFVGACKSEVESPLVRLHIESPVCTRTFQFAWQEKRYFANGCPKFSGFCCTILF